MNADDCIKHCRKNSFELAFVKVRLYKAISCLH